MYIYTAHNVARTLRFLLMRLFVPILRSLLTFLDVAAWRRTTMAHKFVARIRRSPFYVSFPIFKSLLTFWGCCDGVQHDDSAEICSGTYWRCGQCLCAACQRTQNCWWFARTRPVDGPDRKFSPATVGISYFERVCAHMDKHTYTCVYVHSHSWVGGCACVHAKRYVCIMYVCMYVYAYAYVCVCVYI